MTDQELKDIVAAVVAELEKSGVDFDYKAEPAKDGDLVFVIRGTAPNYQGVTVTWKGLLDIITSQVTQAKNDAVTAKNAADKILERVQSNGTAISNFVATSKTEIETQKNESVNAVKSVYQTDLNELKGDLEVLNEFVIYDNFTWSQGVIGGDGEIIPECVTRIYTPENYPLEFFINRCINIDSEYEYGICCYNKDGNPCLISEYCPYLDINNKRFTRSVVWYNTSIYLYDYVNIIGDYKYIRFVIRKKDISIDDTSNPITPDLGSMLTITDDWGKILNSLTYDDGLKIVNEINKNSVLWTQWNNRLAFGMNPTMARVPFNIDGQLYVNGTVIARNTASQNNNRWGFHVYEAYAKDNYSRMTMLLDKHNFEFDGKPTLEYYYYIGANHHASSYGYTKIGSDVLYKSFLFSRDKMIAAGVIDCRFVLTLANISKTNDFNTTYETVEEADEAYEPENEAAENVRCMKYIYYKNATNGSLYYDKDTNHVMAKINGEWQELSYHAVGDIVMSSLSLADFEKAHYGKKWKLIKTESFNDPTGESQTINYYKRIE